MAQSSGRGSLSFIAFLKASFNHRAHGGGQHTESERAGSMHNPLVVEIVGLATVATGIIYTLAGATAGF